MAGAAGQQAPVSELPGYAPNATIQVPEAYPFKLGSLRWIAAVSGELKVNSPQMTARAIREWIQQHQGVDVPLQRVYHANRKFSDLNPELFAQSGAQANKIAVPEQVNSPSRSRDMSPEEMDNERIRSSEAATTSNVTRQAPEANAPAQSRDTAPSKNTNNSGDAPGSAAWLRALVQQLRSEDPLITGKAMQRRIKETTRYDIPLHRVFQAARILKQEELSRTAEPEPDDEAAAASYALLPEYCRQLVLSNRSSVAQVCVKDAEDDFEFSRIFVSLHCLAESFVHCRRLICLQSIQLHGPRDGYLLLATMVDANDQLLPLAWVISQECVDNTWKWFLELLRASLSTVEAPPGQLTFLLEVDEVLANIILTCFPEAHAAYCFESIKEHVKLTSERDEQLLQKAAMATNEPEFARAWQTLKRVSQPHITEQLERLNVDRWVDLRMPHNERLGIYDLSIAKTAATWVEDKQDLPAYRMLQLLQFKSVEALNLHRIEASNRVTAGKLCTETATRHAIENSRKRAGWAVLANVTEDVFICTHGNGQVRRVFWEERRCDCGSWQQRGIPCEHAAAVLGSAVFRASKQPSVDLLLLVNERFHAATWLMTFQYPYEIVPSETLWPLQMADEQLLRAPPLTHGVRVLPKRKETYIETEEGDLTIDGMTETEAHQALNSAIKSAHKRQRSAANAQESEGRSRMPSKKVRLSQSSMYDREILSPSPEEAPEESRMPKKMKSTPHPHSALPQSSSSNRNDIVKYGPGRNCKESNPLSQVQQSPITTHAKKKPGPPKGWKQARALAEAERAKAAAHAEGVPQSPSTGATNTASGTSGHTQRIGKIRLVDSMTLLDSAPAPHAEALDATHTKRLPGRPPGPALLAKRAAIAKENADRIAAGLPPLEDESRPKPKTPSKPSRKKKRRGRPSGPPAKPAQQSSHVRNQQNGQSSQGRAVNNPHYSVHNASPFDFQVQDSNVRGEMHTQIPQANKKVTTSHSAEEASVDEQEESEDDDEDASNSWRGSELPDGPSDEDDEESDFDDAAGTNGKQKTPKAKDASHYSNGKSGSAKDAPNRPNSATDDHGDQVKHGKGMFRRYELITEVRNPPWKSLVTDIEPEPGKARATRQHRVKSADPIINDKMSQSKEAEATKEPTVVTETSGDNGTRQEAVASDALQNNQTVAAELDVED